MVIRIGKLTGNRYDESVDTGSIGECCHVCHSEEEVEKCMTPGMRAKRFHRLLDLQRLP